MTHSNSGATPHTDTVHSAASLPADSDRELDRILRMRDEADVRLIVSVLKMHLATPDGRQTILEVLGTDDDRIRALAREVYHTMPVRPHTHRALGIKLGTSVRGLSRIGAIIGALIGGVLGWVLTSLYAITSISFGTATEVHSVSVTWIKVAIGVLCVIICATVGSLIGGPRRQKEQFLDVDVDLEMAAHTVPASVVATDGGARR